MLKVFHHNQMKQAWPNHTWLGHGRLLSEVKMEQGTKRAVKKAMRHIIYQWDITRTVPKLPKKGKTKRDRMVWAAYKIAALAAEQLDE